MADTASETETARESAYPEKVMMNAQSSSPSRLKHAAWGVLLAAVIVGLSPIGATAAYAGPPAQKKDEGGADPAVRRQQAAKKAAARREARLDRSRTTANEAKGDRSRRARPFAERETAVPSEPGPTTVPDIAAIDRDVRPEDKTYSFSCKDCTYTQLVEGFARQTGLGVIGAAPKDGKVNFVSTERLSFEEALQRVRMLLFNYKPLEPYWLKRKDTHLAVIRVNDVYRDLELKYMFRSVEAFRAADPADDELALVIYTPKTGSVSELRIVRDFMPDYVRVAPLRGNSITIFALVKDIKKYLDLKEVFVREQDDPRTIKPIRIEYILPSEAVTKLGTLMGGSGGGGGSTSRAGRGRSRGKDAGVSLETIRAPGVIMMPHDAQGVLLVRAMQDKIDEIERLLPFIDIDTSTEEAQLVVIPVKHTDAGDLIQTVQQILTVSPPPKQKPAPSRKASRKKGARAVTKPVVGAGVTLMRHPAENAILVFADEERLVRVRELVAQFDVPRSRAPTRVALEHVKAQTMAALLREALGKAPGTPGSTAAARVKIMPDPAGDALWITANDVDLKTVHELLAILDVPEARVTLHVARIVHHQPSFIANVLREYMGAATKPSPVKSKKPRRGSRIAVSRFTPDDERNTLYVLCTDEQWAEFLPLISELEDSFEEMASFTKFTVENIEPEEATRRLSEALGADPRFGPVRYVATDGAFLALNASAEVIAEIQTLLPEIDQAVQFEQRTFQIHHATPGDIKSVIETLVGDGVGGKSSRARSRPGKKPGVAGPATVLPVLTIVEIEDRLIIRTTPTKMVEVVDLIAQLDVADVEMELKVYDDFPPGNDIEAIAITLASEVSGVAAPKGRPRAGKARGGLDGPRFIPQATAGRLIVLAPPSLFGQIERLLDVLRVALEVEPMITAFIEVEFADLDVLIELISPFLEMKVAELVAAGELEDVSPAARGTKPRPTTKRSVSTHKIGSRFHLAADERNRRLVVGAPQVIVEETRRLVALFDKENPPEVEPMITAFIDVEFADLDVLIELISPFLEMKVTELVAAGELEDVSAATRGTKPKPTAKRSVLVHKIGSQFHLAADQRNRRLVVGAPQVIVDETRRLVALFDKEHPAEVLFRTVPLVQAGSKEMVRVLKEMIAPPGRTGIRKKPGLGTATREIFGSSSLTVVEAPGGNAVVLHGPSLAVEQAIEWIKKLDEISTPGRSIEVFQLEFADIRQLGDLIMNVVDAPPKTAGAGRRPRRAAAGGGSVAEEDAFETTKIWSGQHLYIQADLVASTMIVAASEGKLSEVRAIVAQFDDEQTFVDSKPLPKFLYTLEHRDDAFDAAFDLELLLGQIWDPPSETPTVDSLPFGDVLVIKHPDESRFEEIRELIREYIDKPKPGYNELKQKGYSALKGYSATETALLIQMAYPELDIEIIDMSTTKDETYDIEEIKPLPKSKVNRCVLPLAFRRLGESIVAAVSGQTESGESAKTKEKGHRDSGEQSGTQSQSSGTADQVEPIDPVTAAVMKLLRLEEGKSQRTVPRDSPPDGPGEVSARKVRIYVDDATGKVVIEGRQGVVEGAPEWFERIREEIEGLPEIPDIRIYRVRYLDVYTAAEILGEMFNATRQQRQTIQQQQRQAQQRQRQPKQQQQQRQRQQQQQAKGQQGQPQRGGQRGQQAAQPNVPTLPAESVRIYPNPRDRTLILRADTSQFPVLLKLLAKIDQPQPINSDFKVFRLEKLNAADVEELLKSMLGLDARRASRPAGGAARRGATAGRTSSAGQGGYLPRTLMEPMAAGVGALGIDPKDIKLSSNEETNTIIVMAPRVALEFVGELIRKLESEEMPDRITHYYELKHADAAAVADYLESHFGGGSGQAKSGKKGAARAGRLNTPSFIPYSRLNLLTVLATAEQLEEIDGIIERLDVGSETDQWEPVTLAHANAQAVADTLTKMYGGSGSKGKGAAAAGPEAQFIGESGGRILLYSAPQSLHEQILTTIGQLETDASDQTKLRIIKLVHARPSELATAIEDAYGSRGSRAGKSAPTTQLTVTAHDPTGQLFIQSDERLFQKIESLVKSLDVEKTMPFSFRIFPLQYADARQVHGQMTKLWTEYLRLVSPEIRKSMDAMSIDVNEQANALVVMGTPTVFAFLEENLTKIDTPAALMGKPGFLMVALKNANATELAAIITRLWATRGRDSSESPPQVETNRSLNTLIVRGTRAQLDEIKREVIDPLEAQTSQGLVTETIHLKYARADAVAESINRIFEDKKRAMMSAGRDSTVSPLAFTVVVTPDVTTGQVIVQASEENLVLVRARIAELDQEEVAGRLLTRMEIYPVSYAEPSTVAKIINDWARVRKSASSGKGGGGLSEVVSAMAEESTRSVVVTATHANQLIVKGLIDSLDDESIAVRQRQRHVLRLHFASADDIAKQLTQVFKAAAGRSRAQGSPTFVADLSTNALIASVNEEELEEVRQLLSELDRKPSKDIERVTEVYPIRYAAAESLNTVVNNMFRPSRGGVSSPVEQVNSWVESATQTLIVTASPRNHAMVRALIEKADTKSADRSEVHVVQLDNASPEDVAQTLRDILARSGRGGRSGDPRLSISAMKGSKALLIRCSPEDFEEIQTIVAELDRDDASLGEVVRVVTLRYGDASETQTAMQEYLRKPGGGARGGELVGGVRLSVLTQSNALVVSGDKAEVDRLEATIHLLDSAGEAGSVPQIIHLDHAHAGDIVPNLEAVFAEKRGGGRSRTPPVIIANEAANTILVRADTTDLTAIRSLVEQLDTEDELLETFRLIAVQSGINVTDLAEKVERTINESAASRPARSGRSAPRVTITPDKRTNTLLVAGPPSLFDDTEKMVRALEKMGPSSGQVLRIIQLGKVPADEIQRLVDRLRGETSSTSRSRRGSSGRPKSTPKRTGSRRG